MKSKKIFIVVQEGGSSREFYVHAHDTLKESNADRKSCAEASYRTSAPIAVPKVLTRILQDFPGAAVEFYDVLEAVLRAPIN